MRRFELSEYARAGFQNLTEARDMMTDLAARLSFLSPASGVDALRDAADPDEALRLALRLAEQSPEHIANLGDAGWASLVRLLGASEALGEFFLRHPETIGEALSPPDGRLPSRSEATERILAAVDGLAGESAWNALRVAYRTLLAQVMHADLTATAGELGSIRVCETVTHALTTLADAALAAALSVARRTVVQVLIEQRGVDPDDAHSQVQDVGLAVIAMGKSGANELNVVSDVDVIFVHEGDEQLATKIARELMRAIHDPAAEPPLWQVDANLRPEGRNGALVRTLSGMQSYYAKWAKAWEFQALLKARSCAGDLELGEEFVASVQPLVWASASRTDFVGSVQRMRERVTENIDPDEIDRNLKLGPGGLRDIEFSVQLLQLVHGARDTSLRLAGTLPALRALVAGGYVARADGDRLSNHYCTLRVLEHRLQLLHLRRTALMPEDKDALRVLARATGFAATADALLAQWQRVRQEVRELHLKIFYAPLLSAVAALPDDDFHFESERAEARLLSIGFQDPAGALRHLTALTRGTNRRTKILHNLLPVLLQWFGEGTEPDYGLLAFRRITEASEATSWYLRLLRDGSLAAERLAHVLTSSKYATELLESHTEAVAWLEDDDLLRPNGYKKIHTEMASIAARHPRVPSAAKHLRRIHRREILRLALGRVCGVIGDEEVAEGLDAAHSALLETLLSVLQTNHRREFDTEPPEISLIGLGRFGGGELGFASDIDLIAVCRDTETGAAEMVAELRSLVGDPRFPVDLDFDLRPEGKNGPLVRSLASYESYYNRWSLTWEAQALLRARHAAGSLELSAEFLEIADRTRYPETFSESQVREVRAMKARMEGERLPRGADPAMHLKLGPGGLSDVEWLVQLIQLRHGHHHLALRTVSTLTALDEGARLGLFAGSGEVDKAVRQAGELREAWTFASSMRSALKLWNGKSSDVLPTDWRELEGIAGVIGWPRDETSQIVESWRNLSRRARKIVEAVFFEVPDVPAEAYM